MARALKSVTFARTLHEDSGRPVMGPSASIGDNSACYELVQKEGSSQVRVADEHAAALLHGDRDAAHVDYLEVAHLDRPAARYVEE